MISTSNQHINQQSNQQVTNNQPTSNHTIRIKELKEDIPAYEIFKEFALEKKPNVDLFPLKLKYEAWREADWYDGNGRPIKNWREKLLSTLPYIKEKVLATGRREQSDFDFSPLPEGDPMPASLKAKYGIK